MTKDIQTFNYDLNLERALTWQFNDAERLQKLIAKKQEWYERNHSKFWSDWYQDVFNLNTANEFGLNVWSIILGVPIIVQTEGVNPDVPFGYSSDDGNFENSNFQRPEFEAQVLSIEQARLVLVLRYHQLISDGTVDGTNQFLDKLFGHLGGAYVVDNYDMTVNYVFGFQPDSRLSYILRHYDILPRPAGVRIAGITVIPKIPFGFEDVNENFNNGNFV